MSSLVADTHATIWYLSRSPRLSATAHSAMRAAIQGGDPILVASITLVEVVYLIEKGRIPGTAFNRLDQVLSNPLSGFQPVVLDMDVARFVQQVPRRIVPDMPDRIITATAMHRNLPLVTADRNIQVAGVVTTIW